MIEKVLYDFLNDRLSVPCWLEVPKDAPDSYVIIERTNSSRRNHIMTAVFAIQSYAASLYDAAALNQEVRGVMEELNGSALVGAALFQSDYSQTNLPKKQYRYQAVYNIVYRG